MSTSARGSAGFAVGVAAGDAAGDAAAFVISSGVGVAVRVASAFGVDDVGGVGGVVGVASLRRAVAAEKKQVDGCRRREGVSAEGMRRHRTRGEEVEGDVEESHG